MLSKPLMAASTKPLLLAILTDGENYGYRIIQRVKDLTEGKLEWADGMLYPVLHRLEKDKLISSFWKISDNGRRRKYYAITNLGREALQIEIKQWQKVNNLMQDVLVPLIQS